MNACRVRAKSRVRGGRIDGERVTVARIGDDVPHGRSLGTTTEESGTIPHRRCDCGDPPDGGSVTLLRGCVDDAVTVL
jgi:hypothetical protein